MPSVVDMLNVIVTADSKKFIAGMDGVIKQTEATQSAFSRAWATGVKGTLEMTKALVAATAVTAGFGVVVSKMGEQLAKYGSDVPATTIKAFDDMDAAMEAAGKTITIAVGGALASASDGFIIFVNRISEAITNSEALKTLFEGLNYVFAIVGEAIKSVAQILTVVVNGFKTLILGVQVASLAMAEFFDGIDRTDEIDALRGQITALGDESKKALVDAFDYERFITSIEKVYNSAQEREKKRQQDLKNGAAGIASFEALVSAALRKHDIERARQSSALYIQTQVDKKLLEDSYQFSYEIEAKKTALAAQGAKDRLDNAVWLATREEQLANMTRAGVQAIHVQEQQDQANANALWESGWRGKLQTSQGILTNLATLMDTHSRKMFKIGKVAAISDAIISAILGAQQAFTSLSKIPYVGPALGIAAAAAALAAGMANVQRIKAVQYGGGGSVGGGGGASSGASGAGSSTGMAAAAAGPSSTSNVNVTMIGDRFSQSQVRGLLGHINEAAGDNAKIKVKAGF